MNSGNNQPSSAPSDETLLKRFVTDSDAGGFEQLYHRYVHLAYGVCMQILKNGQDSSETVSEVFRILYERLPNTQVQSFRNYLYTVCRNESFAKLRRQRQEQDMQSVLQSMENEFGSFVENDSLLTLFENEQTLESEVRKAIDQLGDGQRNCVRLFFLEGKSYREIARDTGFTEQQVKSHLQNGKRNLRQLLEKVARR
ncbi:MAG: hypothetical protein RLY31_663 [Bacteroidota bacterium]|jgi:RNA polymerase sigma-70 factor (ECF subfamily)